ncbi:hypothetical protein AB0C87_38945, partial [Actinomadura sp. NPDC048021]|uniref:hypothetical protein n=1 Tax=Actinomadura sp. NPDC048021 TaxID=3155385 RepID=UPI0033DD6FE1
QREIEDTLSEKILYNELKPGQIVIVGTEGFDSDNTDTAENAKFTFKGVPKPSTVPDSPPPIEGAVNFNKD